MTRSLFYLAVIGLITFGCFVGYLSIPTHEEITLMYLERGEFEKAYNRLQKSYQSDEENISAIMPMALIHLNRAEIHQAIKIFENAVKRDPDSLNIRMGLTKLYKETDRIREYVNSLLIQYQMSASVITAHELATWFYTLGRFEQEYEILKSIFSNYTLDDQEYIRIGYLSALKDNKQLISDLLESLLEGESTEKPVDDNVIRYYLGLAFNFDNDNKGNQLAFQYFKKDPSPDRLEFVVWAYITAKKEFSIQKYLPLVPKEKLNDEKILSLQYEYLAAREENYEAYTYIKNIFQNRQLSKKLKKQLLRLSLEYETSLVFLKEIFNNVSLTEINHQLVLNFVENAIDKKNIELLDLIITSSSSVYLQEHPELSIALEITKNPKGKPVTQLLNDTKLDSNQKFFIAKILLKNNRLEDAVNLIKKVENIENMTKDELYAYSNMLIDLNLEDYGIKSLNQIKSSIPEEAFEQAMLVFDTSKGTKSKVMNWVETNETVSDDLLKGLFSIADRNKHRILALELALELNSREKNLKNKHVLAIALAKIGQLQTATTMIKKLAKEDSNLKDEELLVLGLASQKEGYESKYKTLLDEVINKKQLSRKQLKEVGFQLLASEAKKGAEPIFWTLSKGKPYNSDEVQGLLSSWEKNLTNERVRWIQKRALDSSPEEKYLWLRHLLWNKKGKEVYSFVKDRITELKLEDDKDLKVVFIESAIQSKVKEGMIAYVHNLSEDEKEVDKLRKYAGYASYFGDTQFALQLYHRILKATPEDYKVIKDIGLTYFSMGVYDKAKFYLNKAMTFDEVDYLVYFYYGEIMLIDKRYRCSNYFFYKALAKLSKLENKQSSEITIEGGIYYRLGYYYKALKKFTKAIQMAPDNELIHFEKNSVLIDLECFCYVKNLLWGNFLSHNIENDIFSKEEEWIALQVSRLQYLKRVYCFRYAKAICCELLQSYPDKTSILIAAADLMNLLNKKQAALRFLSKAKRIEPYNQNLKIMEKDVLKTYLPNVIWGRESKVTDDVGDEERYRLFLAAPLSRRDARCDLLIEVDHFDLLAKLDIESGKGIPFNGTRERFSVGLLHPFRNGLELNARLYYSNPNIGFEVLGNYSDNFGGWDFIFAYNKPEWDFLQTLVDRGTVNKFQIMRTFRWIPRSIIQARMLCNQLHLEILKNAAAYSLFDFRLDTQLNNPNHWLSKCLLGKNTLLNWSVLYEYEKPHHSKSFNTIFGVDIIPIALEERSTIRSALFYQKEIDHKFTLRGHYGYLYNFKTLEWNTYYGGGVFMKIPGKLHFDIFYEFLPPGGSSTTANATKKFFIELGGNY